MLIGEESRMEIERSCDTCLGYFNLRVLIVEGSSTRVEPRYLIDLKYSERRDTPSKNNNHWQRTEIKK